MSKEGFVALLNIALYTTLLPIGIGLVKWKSLDPSIKALVLLAIASFTAEQATIILRSQHINSNILLQVYNILGTGLFSYFYFQIIKRQTLKKPLIFIYIAITSISIYGWFISTNPNLSGALLSTHTIFLLVLGLIYFASLFTDTEPQPILRNHLFWINSGLVFYAAGVLTLFISMEYLINVLKVDMYLFWSINNILNITLHISYFVGIWLSLRKASVSEN